MRSLSEVGVVRVLSKIPSEMDWFSEKMEKLVLGCNKGYAKLQSSRISRGRLTMTDISDERATTAWSEQIWTKNEAAREWPAVLRPQRPEQLSLNRCGQSQRKNKRRIHQTNTDVLENPPVFLTIKDIMSLKEANEAKNRPSTPRRIKKNSTGDNSSKNSPTFPAALLTYDRGVSPTGNTMVGDMELLGIELAREYHYCQEELIKRKEQVAELSKKETTYVRDIDDLMSKLKVAGNEVQEVRAQLKVRSEATLRLEQENSAMRDSIAKLFVQVETSNLEKDQILQKWQMAESERISWKRKCEELEEAANENTTFKEQCLLLQSQFRTTVAKIVAQQETVKKEYVKVERAAHDAVSFSKMVSTHLNQQDAKAKEVAKLVEESERKFLALSVELKKVRCERDQYVSEKQTATGKSGVRYYEEWEKSQENMKARIEGFIIENQRLSEELDLVRSQINRECVPSVVESKGKNTSS